MEGDTSLPTMGQKGTCRAVTYSESVSMALQMRCSGTPQHPANPFPLTVVPSSCAVLQHPTTYVTTTKKQAVFHLGTQLLRNAQC